MDLQEMMEKLGYVELSDDMAAYEVLELLKDQLTKHNLILEIIDDEDGERTWFRVIQ